MVAVYVFAPYFYVEYKESNDIYMNHKCALALVTAYSQEKKDLSISELS